VDPDNRRPVDYARRAAMLRDLKWELREDRPDLAERARALVDRLDDGRAKLYVTWRCLDLRRRCAEHFRHGEYLPLTVRGPRQDFICAHAWRHDGRLIVAAAPRWFASLMREGVNTPLGEAAWADTLIYLPPAEASREFVNLFTGETVHSVACAETEACTQALHAATVFHSFPVALLLARNDTRSL
jgi:(1->4)-alpha-D-glucan 1-alpha-D-glucosylmutase